MTAESTVPGLRARDLTPAEADDRMKRIVRIEKDIVEGLRVGRTTLWAVAKSLYEWDEESGWTALGYETIGEWLAQPEIGMSRKTYYRSVQMWREFIVMRGLDPRQVMELDISKIEVVLPALKAGRVDLDDALADAEAMPQRDLREKYYGEDKEEERQPDVEQPLDEEPARNGTDDEPRWADEDEDGHVPPTGEGSDDIVGTATEIGEDGERKLHDLRDVVDRARAALQMPQRLPGARQTVRAALEELIAEIEAYGLWHD